jgi:hypothetical protein
MAIDTNMTVTSAADVPQGAEADKIMAEMIAAKNAENQVAAPKGDFSFLNETQQDDTPSPAPVVPASEPTAPVPSPTAPVPEPTAPPPPEEQAFWDRVAPFTAAREAAGGVVTDQILTDAAAAFGVPKSAVQAFLSAAEAKAAVITAPPAPSATAISADDAAVANAQVIDKIGGSQEWAGFTQWAQSTLSSADLKSWNEASPTTRVKLAEIYAPRFTQAKAAASPARNATDGKPAGGTPPVNGGLQPFDSEAALLKAIEDPQYAKDAQYRADVYKRIALSRK